MRLVLGWVRFRFSLLFLWLTTRFPLSFTRLFLFLGGFAFHCALDDLLYFLLYKIHVYLKLCGAQRKAFFYCFNNVVWRVHLVMIFLTNKKLYVSFKTSKKLVKPEFTANFRAKIIIFCTETILEVWIISIIYILYRILLRLMKKITFFVESFFTMMKNSFFRYLIDYSRLLKLQFSVGNQKIKQTN